MMMRVSSKLRVLVVLTASCMDSVYSPAQEVGSASLPPALLDLRKRFEAAAAQETVGLNALFEPHLANLEMNAGATGDYALALAAKRRRESLLASSEHLKSLPGVAIGITLPFTAAKLTGGVTLRGNTLENWTTSAAGAEWTLPSLPVGRYEVKLKGAVVAQAAVAVSGLPVSPVASMRFKEVSLLATASNSVLVPLEAVPATMDDASARPVIVVQRQPITFRLEIMNPGQVILALSEVVLEPQVETSIPGAAPPPNAAVESAASVLALQKADAMHQQRLKEAMTPVVKEYLTLLAAVEEKGAGARVMQAEVKRVSKILDAGPEAFLQLTPSMSKTGLTTLTDVHFVSDAGNTGDRFRVEHEGEPFWVKLMWTTSAPLDARKGRVMDLIKSRFKVDELGAVALGQAAREFTELYLSGKPLKLITRATPGADGSLTALVYLESDSLYQQILIDHGLAVVDSPERTPGTRRAALEAGIIADLEEHEKRAQAAAAEGGGWYRGK
jgi:hypothetical protein